MLRQTPAPKELPTVSVIIPVYNRKNLIASAVESVLAQDWPALEVIVVDDASTDNTAGFVEQKFAGKVRVVRQLTNQGPGSARNRGIADSKGTFIRCFDSDDELAPGSIRGLAETLLSHPNAMFAYGRYGRKKNGQPLPIRLPDPTDHRAWPTGDLLDQFARRPFFHHTDVMFRRSCVPADGNLYPPMGRHLEDYLAMVTLLSHGPGVPYRAQTTWICSQDNIPRLREAYSTVLEQGLLPLEWFMDQRARVISAGRALGSVRARFHLALAHAAKHLGESSLYRHHLTLARKIDPPIMTTFQFVRSVVRSYVA